jgi:hypothetical protein
MATRKIFIDENGHKIMFELKDNHLCISIEIGKNNLEIKEGDELLIDLSAEDSKDFIMDLYRIKKQIV